MATNGIDLPLIVIVGPTASGKTGLAIRIARKFSGEIISADSRAVYRGLDIGTAKPTIEERRGVPHWGIDLVDPGQRFTVADFKHYADQKILEIRARGKLPILVGGTGLYVDSVVYDFQFPESSNDLEFRRSLECMSLDDLYIHCKNNHIKLPENRKNKRYVINSILRNNNPPLRNRSKLENTILIGICTDRKVLRGRIAARAKSIVTDTTIAEAEYAASRWGWDNEAMTGNIYPLIRQYKAGDISLTQLEEKFRVLDWRLAKRQLTWLKRNSDITWLNLDDAWRYVSQKLSWRDHV